MEGQDEGGTVACNVRKGDNIKEGMKLRNLQKLSKVWQISPNRQNIIFFFLNQSRRSNSLDNTTNGANGDTSYTELEEKGQGYNSLHRSK